MKRLVATLVIMATVATFSGCGEEGWGLDWRIMGTWSEINSKYYPRFQVTFHSNGVVVFQHSTNWKFSGTGSWHTEGSTLYLARSSQDYSDEYEYEQVGDRLKLVSIDGYEIEFIRIQ